MGLVNFGRRKAIPRLLVSLGDFEHSERAVRSADGAPACAVVHTWPQRALLPRAREKFSGRRRNGLGSAPKFHFVAHVSRSSNDALVHQLAVDEDWNTCLCMLYCPPSRVTLLIDVPGILIKSASWRYNKLAVDEDWNMCQCTFRCRGQLAGTCPSSLRSNNHVP